MLHAARWKCRTQKIAKNSPSAHHRINLSGYIFTTKPHIDNRKILVKQQYLRPTCPYIMANFGLLAAEVVSLVLEPQLISTGVASWQRYCTARHSSSGRQRNFAALNRGSHLYLAGLPSRWALAHILVMPGLWFLHGVLTIRVLTHSAWNDS